MLALIPGYGERILGSAVARCAADGRKGMKTPAGRNFYRMRDEWPNACSLLTAQEAKKGGFRNKKRPPKSKCVTRKRCLHPGEGEELGGEEFGALFCLHERLRKTVAKEIEGRSKGKLFMLLWSAPASPLVSDLDFD